MITNPLVFYISPQWKQINITPSINKQEKFTLKHLYKSKSLDTCHNQSTFNPHIDHCDNHRCITIDLNTNEDNIKTAKDLNQILKDIQTYRNQLHDTHGSIHIHQAYSSQSNRCCCNHNQTSEICQKIFKMENELFQNDFVEYIYKIECITNKNSILK